MIVVVPEDVMVTVPVGDILATSSLVDEYVTSRL